ncbi:MAG: SDR family NAD(P)-dependent oxidoreductase [Chitinophagaceae bacterium]|nr:SDR family NAD(P)-dependent oxidoreductase [Chitinophagaceae bacterium]
MKTAIVTGASGNLGQAVVKKFLAEGYFVIGTVIPNDHVSLEIKGQHFETAIVDLTAEKETQQFVEFAAIKHGDIDAAVITVGGFALGGIAATKTSDIASQYKLNFETAYNVARPVFMQMMQQGRGRIFLIGSRPGLDMKNSKGMVAYGLTKSLLFRLADLLNDEAKGLDVVATVIVPSTIDTPVNRKSMPEADFSKWVTPDSIAEVIYFYCSETGAAVREPVIKLYGNS